MTFKKAYEMAKSMEMAQARAVELQASTKVSSSVQASTVQYVHGKKPPQSDKQRVMVGSCDRCGKSGHTPDQFYFRTQRCRSCCKRGHIARVCRARARTNFVEEVETAKLDPEPPTSTDHYLFNVQSLKVGRASIVVDVTINKKELPMDLDTGAAVSLISEETWKSLSPETALDKSTVLLKTYTGEPLHIVGQKTVLVKYGKQKNALPLVVVAG